MLEEEEAIGAADQVLDVVLGGDDENVDSRPLQERVEQLPVEGECRRPPASGRLVVACVHDAPPHVSIFVEYSLEKGVTSRAYPRGDGRRAGLVGGGMDTIIERIARGAEDAPAILAPDGVVLTHGGLRRLMAETAARLNALGIGRGDRVAIVLANGPEMATAFVSVAAAATTAPLNPGYREEEFDFYLSDIGAKALIVAADEAGPSVAVAERRGIAVLRLLPDPDGPAGRFTLEGAATGAAARPGLAEAGDIALLLHTSGTTSRPKLVPLTHANLAASAAHIGATLRLTPDDRCLNIMPLFHIHGLIAAVLASLAAGGSTFCTPGFNALRFFALARRGEAELVHGGADHAPGDPRPRRAKSRGGRRGQAPLHPLVLGVAAAAGDGGARSDCSPAR